MARRGADQGPTGLVVIDKEPGWTSHDVVAKLRGLLGQRRTGHAGTLDPSATGVLLVGVGRATRLMRFLQDTTKAYEGELVLGTTTTTLDADGEVTGTFSMDSVTPAQVAEAAKELTGSILQVPPMVSALKVDGKRLHELARAGIEVERKARPVTVEHFETTETPEPGRYRFSVVCSSGTYVRSLVDDLGRALGGGAHMASLRRTAVGSFTLADAHTLAEVAERSGGTPGSADFSGLVLTPAEALRGLASIQVDAEAAERIGRGMALDAQEWGAVGAGPFAVLDPDGALLGVYDGQGDGRLTASVVLAASQ